ncbi:hypothetical protein BpHYR1_023451, partial [Brachionus plicatilis]
FIEIFFFKRPQNLIRTLDAMTKPAEKYLLVVSFLEGENFPERKNTKFVIEAKFDGEQLSTDPVEHSSPIDISQELAWGLDKKSLQLHKLQRSCIKANCFAINQSSKEHVGYIVIDIRSAPESPGRPKFFPLLQSIYAKSKPQIKVNIYTEEDQSNQEEKPELEASQRSTGSRPGSSHSAQQAVPQNFQVVLDENEGYFSIGKSGPDCKIYVLTITIAFARNLVRLLTNSDQHSTSNFFFMYKFLGNQVATKPFGDIISCQINGERSSIRFCSTLENFQLLFKQLANLEIFFCSQDRAVGKCVFNWRLILENWDGNSLASCDNPIVLDELLKIEALPSSQGRVSPAPDVNMAPVIGLQVGVFKEETEVSNVQESKEINVVQNEAATYRKSPSPTGSNLKQSSQVIFQNECNTITVEERPKESIVSLKSSSAREFTTNHNAHYIPEDLQLKAAYELQLWKEAREKEFEHQLKKNEAKKFQALADAFKQRDIEREIMVQKKIKEYNELEVMLKNSLNEVEKREKQLASNEAHIARMRSDLNRDYENKLSELREASKRVQEKADHQVSLQKSKIESLEDEIDRLKKKVYESEKRCSEKESEFLRFKEKENNRPEIRLQSEINVLNLEKIELERKLDAMTKAKNHYKEQWTKALQEIALMKKKEESNAKALLRRQQMELENMKMKFLSAEESEKLKSDEQELLNLKNEIEKLKLKNSDKTSLVSDYGSASCLSNLENIDPNLQNHINRLLEEKETLLRTGVYSNSDAIIIELDKRIKDSLNQANFYKN